MRSTVILTLAGLALAGCQRPSEVVAPAPNASAHTADVHAAASPSALSEIAQLREATARFHDFSVAEAEGMGTQITNCFSHPTEGAMGFHYGNPAGIDATIDALKPELLLYEPLKNGGLRFVAVEYAVPFTAWTSENPPSLFGQSFHRNETFGLWVLHVWHFQANPKGIFNDWNPNVSCQYATP